METPRKKNSRKTMALLGLLLLILALTAVFLLLYFGRRYLFVENERFTIREIEVDCQSGFWAGKTEMERQHLADDFAKRARIEKGVTKSFEHDLGAMRRRILNDIPEIETLEIRRVLPDVLSFKIICRTPRADTGLGYYLDDEGTVLQKNLYPNLEKSLPVVADITGIRADLIRGEKITSRSMLTALCFIRMIELSEDTSLQKIQVRQMVGLKNQDQLQAILYYKNDPRPFKVIFSNELTFDDMTLEIPAKLIPAMEKCIHNPAMNRVLNMKFGKAVYSPQ